MIIIKRLLSFILLIFIPFSFLTGCSSKKNTDNLTKVKLNEVARSIFYAPMYVAITEGYFKEEGLEIDLTTGQGADKTMQQVMSQSVDIGFSGPEQVIYIYNQGREDYPVVFAQLTQTDGSFLIGRKEEPNFSYSDLEGKTIIGGRPAGVPEMALEYVLRNNGLVNGKNVNIITNIGYTATAGAFKAGTGDYVALFEPTGSMLERDKAGYIVSSIGKEAGTIPYTCFYAPKSYIEAHPDIIQKFTNAIHKGQDYVASHTEKEIAERIVSFFPGSDVALVEKVVKNYMNVGSYAKTPVLTEENLNRLENIIQSYDNKLLPKRPPYKDIVNNTFSEKAIK